MSEEVFAALALAGGEHHRVAVLGQQLLRRRGEREVPSGVPLPQKTLGGEPHEVGAGWMDADTPARGLPGDGGEVQDRGVHLDGLCEWPGPREQPLTASWALAPSAKRGGVRGGQDRQVELVAVGLEQPFDLGGVALSQDQRAQPEPRGLECAVERGTAGTAGVVGEYVDCDVPHRHVVICRGVLVRVVLRAGRGGVAVFGRRTRAACSRGPRAWESASCGSLRVPQREGTPARGGSVTRGGVLSGSSALATAAAARRPVKTQPPRNVPSSERLPCIPPPPKPAASPTA